MGICQNGCHPFSVPLTIGIGGPGLLAKRLLAPYQSRTAVFKRALISGGAELADHLRRRRAGWHRGNAGASGY